MWESTRLVYNVGNYRSHRGKIYKKVWWFIYKCIDKGPYSFMEGVRIVNDLNAVERRA
jgi:hypothetical protein